MINPIEAMRARANAQRDSQARIERGLKYGNAVERASHAFRSATRAQVTVTETQIVVDCVGSIPVYDFDNALDSIEKTMGRRGKVEGSGKTWRVIFSE